MIRSLVLAEQRRGSLREVSLEALSAAKRLPGELVGALLPGGSGDVARELARCSPRVLHAGGAALEHYDPAVRTSLLRSVIDAE